MVFCGFSMLFYDYGFSMVFYGFEGGFFYGFLILSSWEIFQAVLVDFLKDK